MAEQQYDAFSTLRSFVRQPKARERCDLCGVGLIGQHEHLLDPSSHKLMCACTACALLFPSNGPTKYKRVPRRIRLLNTFQMTDAQWADLMIPIGMAYFVNRSAEERVFAFYPSPAGATESLLPLASWDEIVRDNPTLNEMEPDTDALLVNRLERQKQGSEYYLLPIDKCYELVGIIRTRWRGLSGGTELWQDVRYFFDQLREHAVPERPNA